MFCNIAEKPGFAEICLVSWIRNLGYDSAISYSTLDLFLVQLPLTSFSLPYREFSFVSQFSEPCCKSFCPVFFSDRNKHLFTFLTVNNKIILHFTIFIENEPQKFPNHLITFPGNFFSYFLLAP